MLTNVLNIFNVAESKGGWGLFSFFSRSSTPSQEKKPVKANLGEESQFYYDEKEKRWINKAVSRNKGGKL